MRRRRVGLDARRTRRRRGAHARGLARHAAHRDPWARGVAAEMPLPELDSLGTPELQAVLDSIDTPLGTTVQGVDTGDLDDLNAHELQHVLDGLEG